MNRQFSILLFLAPFLSLASADQSIVCGDGELRWEVVKRYYNGTTQIGVQTNALTWKTDLSGTPIWMTLEHDVWSDYGNEYHSFTGLNPYNSGITWRVDMESPRPFLEGLFDSTETTSTIVWSNHDGTKSTTVATTDPDIYTHIVWLDWKKSGKTISPRITIGDKPKNFDQVSSTGARR